MVEKKEQDFINDMKEVKKTTIDMDEEHEDSIIRSFIDSIYGAEYLKNSIDLKEIFKYVNQKDVSLLKQDIFDLLLRYKIKKDIQSYIEDDDADLSKIIKFLVKTMDDLEKVGYINSFSVMLKYDSIEIEEQIEVRYNAFDILHDIIIKL